jgi:polyribonucleotide nucleotidyltransferase
MISDLTAVPEVGKTYLGKVVRLAEFGAFVEIFPGTDGLLHVSEIAEHRVKDVKDELRDGDQILVKVLAIEGNRIKLSRKAVLREQRAKLGLPEVPPQGGESEGRDRGAQQAAPANGADLDEEDDDFEEGDEEEGAEESGSEPAEGAPAAGGDQRPPQGQRRGRRRRSGRRPGGNGGGQQGGGNQGNQ